MKAEDYLKNIDENGVMLIGSQMKRLTDLLFVKMQDLYEQRGIEFKAIWFSFLLALYKHGPMDLKTLAAKRKITSSATSQVVRELVKAKLVKTQVQANDSRFKTISLTKSGKAAVLSTVPCLRHVEEIMMDLLGDDLGTLLSRMTFLENELRAKPYTQRISKSIQIVPYQKKYKDYFTKTYLNWLQVNFGDEMIFEYDTRQLKDPEKTILDKGGEIFFLLDDGELIGYVTMVHHSDETVEISKLIIEEEYRGQGLGKLLIQKGIDYAKEKNYKEVLIITHSSLAPAIHVYEKYGFTKIPLPKDANERYGHRADLSFKLLLA